MINNKPLTLAEQKLEVLYDIPKKATAALTRTYLEIVIEAAIKCNLKLAKQSYDLPHRYSKK